MEGTEGGGKTGIGYTYSNACIVELIRNKLTDIIQAQNALAPQAAFATMRRAVRNLLI